MTRTPDMGHDSVERSLRQPFDDHLSASAHCEDGVLAATALRTASLPARAMLAHAATRGTGTLDDLLSAARSPDGARLQDLDIDPHALCDLARVIALQVLQPDDRAVSLALDDRHLQCFGPDRRRRHQNLHAQLTLEAGRRDELKKLLATYDRLSAANGDTLPSICGTRLWARVAN